ncbi:diacylglycerol O-acyltransferase 1 [Sorochytrium milnesiophthora]
MPIQFAPLNVPAHRRRQTLGVLLWGALMTLSLSLYCLLLYIKYTRPLAVAYTIWYMFFDKAPEQGGRRSMLRDYFPIQLIKESELDPSKKYIFGYHPHGIIGIGAWVNFATEATNFSTLFPGIHLRLLTLSTNFRLPIFREVILWLSLASVSRKSVEAILAKGPGHSAMIVVGGAQESLYSKMGTMDLVLHKRLGFIKIAIRNGACLVPVLSIGENDVYDLIPFKHGTFAYSLQQFCKNTFGWTLPVFSGRGIFNYSFGMLPHRRRIATIVGTPIDPVQVCLLDASAAATAAVVADESTDSAKPPAAADDTAIDAAAPAATVDKKPDLSHLSDDDLLRVAKLVQAQYIQQLKDLWDKHKDQYAAHRTKELEIVE